MHQVAHAKSCFDPRLSAVVWLSFICFDNVAGVSLRSPLDTALSTSAAPDKSLPPTSWRDYISEQNLYGVIILTVVIILLLVSFVYKGSVAIKYYKIRIFKISLSATKPERNIYPEINVGITPLSAVLKLNSLNPIHFVVPISDQKDVADLVEFEIQEKSIPALSLSLVVREGNIPIHFESLELGDFFQKWKSSSPNGGRTVLETERLTQPDTDVKLKNRNIQIHYSIR